MKALPIQILGTGIYLPQNQVRSADLDRRLGLASGTIAAKTGVEVRHHADGETVADMGAAAAKAALAAAGLRPQDIDVLVSVGASPQQLIPCNAVLIQRQLGLADSGTPAFDIDATCLGFMVGLDLMSAAIATGRYRRVLLVASEYASRGLDWNHIESAGLFGDGAAAVVLGPGEDRGGLLRHVRIETYGSGADHCRLYGGGSALPGYEYTPANREQYLFRMDGRKLFKNAAENLPPFVDRVCAAVRGLAVSDLDLVIPHQASVAAMALIRKRLKVAEERWVRIIETHGNCMAASIPMALHVAATTGRLRRGHEVMLLGTGAGVAYGAAVLRF